MTDKTMTIPEIRRAGLEALLERLGPDGTLRFLQQYDPGQGDYTSERKAWLERLTIEEIAAAIRSRSGSGE
mgnify:CR=1 FL=1